MRSFEYGLSATKGQRGYQEDAAVVWPGRATFDWDGAAVPAMVSYDAVTMTATLTPAASALLLTALYALHPAHVESVAWISALNDPLFGVFTVLCLFFFAWDLVKRTMKTLKWIISRHMGN